MEEISAHPISIRPMQVGDLSFCRHLVNEAGWNQMDNDWLRAMDLEPEGCFIATIGDLPVATTTVCCFGHIGWIAMVLVNKRNRNQGIGKLLVKHAIFAHFDGKPLFIDIPIANANALAWAENKGTFISHDAYFYPKSI